MAVRVSSVVVARTQSKRQARLLRDPSATAALPAALLFGFGAQTIGSLPIF